MVTLLMIIPEADLEEKTRRLGYPSFSSIKKANLLAKNFMKTIPQNLTDMQKEELFIYPGIYFSEYMPGKPAVDPYIFSSAVKLNNFLLTTKQLYARNGIELNEKHFLDEATLCSILPPVDALNIRKVGTDANAEDIAREIPIPTIEAIENQMYFLFQYDSEKTTPRFDRNMKKRIQQVSNLAKIASNFPDILRGANLPIEAGGLEEAIKNLKNKKTLWDTIQADQVVRVVKPLIRAHAQLKGLRYTGEAWDFYDSMGHEITAAMEIAKNIEFHSHLLENQALSKENNISFVFGEYLYFDENVMKKDKTEKELYKRDPVSYLSEHIIEQDEAVGNLSKFAFSKAPFLGLENQLTSLGIPSGKATAMTEYLSTNILNRSIPADGKKFTSKKTMVKEISTEGDYFNSAASQFIGSITGKMPTPHSYNFYENSDLQANAIRVITYVAEMKNGRRDGN